MRLPACALLALAVSACDPAATKRLAVYDERATAPIEWVLREFEAHQLGSEFTAVEVRPEIVEQHRAYGYEILRWYDHAPTAPERGSNSFHLAVLREIGSERIELSSVEFPAFRESPELRALRERLAGELCRHGFGVEEVCEVGAAE